MNELKHYGVSINDGAPGRGSGRYPFGSGENPFQHAVDFMTRVNQLKSEGLSDTEIAKSMGLTTTQFRTQKSLANADIRAEKVATAKRLRESGMSLDAIAKEMGYDNDSSVRSLLDSHAEARMNTAVKTAEFLKKQVDEHGMIDVGAGVDRDLGVSGEKLKEALYILEMQGYKTFGGRVPQVTNKNLKTTIKVLTPPGTEHKEIFNFENVHTINDMRSHDDGETFKPRWEYPVSMDSKRLQINYAEDGGINKDGVIEIRRGVEDLSLGESHYAQVRILVDDTHYLKGMAVYADDLPKGVDVRFNTNKTKDKAMMDVLKPINTADPDNPFGALLREEGGQSYYTGKDGKEHLSLINKTRHEGDWRDWKDKLPSQFLGKQSLTLAGQQLNLAKANKQAEYAEIMALTNPTIKKNLLMSFAEDCDSAAVHLKAAALPRQKYQVLLPLTSINDKEVYAPNYRNGEKVALIRYPHGGTFEIPILTVNNKNKEGIQVLGSSPADAIGLSKNNADRLSGADFDGDTAMVIPISSRVKIKSDPPLKGLEGYDPKTSYPYREGMKVLGKEATQTEMGKISNLITDMTLKGASQDELAKAVRHSMTVIDANKHKLDYKLSEKDNDIAALKRKYQGKINPETGKMSYGASTLLSRAKGQATVDKRQGSPRINEDGSLSYKTADDLYWVDKAGNTHKRTQKSTQMAETSDARTLISEANTKMEQLYANYANSMKALANSARKEATFNTPKLKYSASAKNTYQKEVDDLNAKLAISEKNRPKERQAQLIANSRIKAKLDANPDMSKKDQKKLKQRELDYARTLVGAQRIPIDITDKEWKAIQSGAISESKLNRILKYADKEKVRKLATPRQDRGLSDAQEAQIRAMRAAGYTVAEVADRFGVSTSTISRIS